MMAVILAGGIGSRLMPYTENIPKPLVLVNNKPILEYILHQLKKYHFENVILAVNHKADMIREVIGDGSRFGLSIKYSEEDKPLSTVAPLKLIDNLDDYFLVINGDVLTDLNFNQLFDFHREHKNLITVAAHLRSNQIDYGLLHIDDNSHLIGFEEKPQSDYLVSMGVYIFSKTVLDFIPDNQPFGFDNLMDLLLEQKRPVAVYQYRGYWRDIGRVEDYLAVQEETDRIKKFLD